MKLYDFLISKPLFILIIFLVSIFIQQNYFEYKYLAELLFNASYLLWLLAISKKCLHVYQAPGKLFNNTILLSGLFYSGLTSSIFLFLFRNYSFGSFFLPIVSIINITCFLLNIVWATVSYQVIVDKMNGTKPNKLISFLAVLFFPFGAWHIKSLMSKNDKPPVEESCLLIRRKLIPLWIKLFMVVIMIWFLIMIFTMIFTTFNLEGLPYGISLYGLKAETSFSHTGLLIQFLFLFKAVVVVFLWHGYKHAVNLAIIDALIGITLMIVYIVQSLNSVDQGWNYDIRFELFLLIPYLISMILIRAKWLKAEKR